MDIENRIKDFSLSEEDTKLILKKKMCRYEKIFQVPPDIKPDWKFAVDEMMAIIKTTFDSYEV